MPSFLESPSSAPLLIPHQITPHPPQSISNHHHHHHLNHLNHLMAKRVSERFEDYLPAMAEKLGGDGLMEELCNGFRLLMDPEREVITFESLKRSAGLLGLGGLRDDELMGMMREGDMDGDGALNQMEFCVLMFRLSPDLMDESWRCLDEALAADLNFTH